MKTYFVESDDLSSLKTALGRMIEYAKFLENESGRSYDNYVDTIIEECDINARVEEV